MKKLWIFVSWEIMLIYSNELLWMVHTNVCNVSCVWKNVFWYHWHICVKLSIYIIYLFSLHVYIREKHKRLYHADMASFLLEVDNGHICSIHIPHSCQFWNKQTSCIVALSLLSSVSHFEAPYVVGFSPFYPLG